jgi:hypothetical protein
MICLVVTVAVARSGPLPASVVPSMIERRRDTYFDIPRLSI